MARRVGQACHLGGIFLAGAEERGGIAAKDRGRGQGSFPRHSIY
jgi:hypothetical protein